MADTLITHDDPILRNRKELAHALGVPPWFIRRMLSYGFQMPLGRASVKMAHEWMEANKDIIEAKRAAAKKRPENHE